MILGWTLHVCWHERKRESGARGRQTLKDTDRDRECEHSTSWCDSEDFLSLIEITDHGTRSVCSSRTHPYFGWTADAEQKAASAAPEEEEEERVISPNLGVLVVPHHKQIDDGTQDKSTGHDVVTLSDDDVDDDNDDEDDNKISESNQHSYEHEQIPNGSDLQGESVGNSASQTSASYLFNHSFSQSFSQSVS